MKNTILTAVLGATLMTAAMAFAQTEKKMPAKPAAMAGRSALSDALMHHEQMMLESLQKKDFAGFKKLIMAGSMSVDENGAALIEEFLKGVMDPKANFSFEFKTSDMKVVSLDANTAVVTYRLDQKGSVMGQPFPPTVYATTIWANHGGTWMGMFHQ